ncbi:MFS transporter [Nocardia bovistercoris]|uniref:MFS transporter n=1 Tax=Nocardia bovistercoris TaxID=2785916 RepID=A0A931IHC3_9NOCA|nr:MFS transporter [Nocardia bovistercoris]MBH0779740.1 MFS transporter [Nocardia bovistercoris]
MSTSTSAAAIPAAGDSQRASRPWARQLQHYPRTPARFANLAIVLLITIVLYYLTYVQGSVAAQIMRKFDFTFTQYVYVGVVGALVGALSAYGAGIADRWGRCNVVLVSMLVTVLLIAFGMPNAGGKVMYFVLFALVSVAEGVALVASPALVRDFSPQLGRAQAMGFWSLGPVLGSIVVTQVSSRTLDDHPDWRFQFYIAGAVGLVVWVIAAIGLRELSPQLRDQLIVSERDRALIEAKAAGIDPDEALEGQWRRVLRFDIIGSSLAIGLYLLFYTMAAGFLVVYLVTVFNRTEAQANAIMNWYWIPAAITLIITGFGSDLSRVRKPFIVVGTVISIIGLILFIGATTDKSTSVDSLQLFLAIAGIGHGLVNTAWMAAFTESVEKHNPASTAAGLAIWGSTARLIFTIALAIFPFAVSATTTLVEDGPALQEITTKYAKELAALQTADQAALATLRTDPTNAQAQVAVLASLSGKSPEDVGRVMALSAQYPQELATVGAVDPNLLTAMAANPADQQAAVQAIQQIAQKFGIAPTEAIARLQAVGTIPPTDLAFLQTNGPGVQQSSTTLQAIASIPATDLQFMQDKGAAAQQATEDNPKQWQKWWIVCLIGQILFLPSVFLLTGRWNPRRAEQDEIAHEQQVRAEMATLTGR